VEGRNVTNYWVLQANPKLYDIDRALSGLSEIRWRAPQYTGAIATGDGVAIWRSGPEAGFVGVGRVVGHPGEMIQSADESVYGFGAAETSIETRVPLAVRPTPHVSKPTVAQLGGWANHPVVVAPMGTVFPITPEQWASLSPHLAELPAPKSMSPSAMPPTFAWDQRSKDAYPMPGGYSGYIDSLRRIATEVSDRPPNRAGLEEWMRATFEVSESNARLGAGFLLKIGALVQRGDLIELGDFTQNWLHSGNNAIIIALMHSRVRFVGELLNAAAEPKSIAELLDIANSDFGAGWTTKAQVQRRRGWLQSAGMLVEVGSDRLQASDLGKWLVEHVTLQAPIDGSPLSSPLAERPASAVTEEIEPGSTNESQIETSESVERVGVEALIARLQETGNDGQKHEQFEIETAEAFGRLGFNSTWLGKSGRTDVLLEAELGRGASYRVIVDCKSTSSGFVSNQIDWDTIDEHRAQHRADHALILAPDFGGGRTSTRAKTHETVLLKIEDLAELLRLHDETPLTLDDYRLLFTSDDSENPTAAIGEIGEEAKRRLELAGAVIELLEARGPKMGPMSARDFFGALIDRDDLPDATTDEIEEILTALASPILGLLRRTDDGAVRLGTSPRTGADSMRRLADRIGTPRIQEQGAST
jgi:hypothetical protein